MNAVMSLLAVYILLWWLNNGIFICLNWYLLCYY